MLSEITHPLDLACYISKIIPNTPYEINSATCNISDYVMGGHLRPDTLMINISFNNIVITGISSYLQSVRTRKMEFMLTDNNGIIEIATLIFDSPNWDDDFLIINRVTKNSGKLSEIINFKTNSNKNIDRLNIEKICLFLEDVILYIDSNKSKIFADKNEALYIQDLVDNIYMKSRKIGMTRNIFEKIENRLNINKEESDHDYDDNF